MRVQADQTVINDCAIASFGDACIDWSGSFGECSGCWFFARDPGVRKVPGEGDWGTRFPAIRFATRVVIGGIGVGKTGKQVAATQGNLVTNAHMLECVPLFEKTGAAPNSPIEWLNEFMMDYPDGTAPPPPNDRNPNPPLYDSTVARWSNRLCTESCYYWDAVKNPI